MADTVVTIGGDSSGLQDAFKDAAKKADGLKDEAKKLTDQLREVADEADKAAGAFVQKFGGPGAIKAIGGIGVALGGAKAVVEAFLDSSEALFKSYGDEGQKVWDDTEKSLFAIKGAFAEAVLGGGTMEEMGARLKGIFEATKNVVDGLLTPVRLLAEAFWGNGDASKAAAAGIKDFNTATERAKTNIATMAVEVENFTKMIWQMTGQTEKQTAATYADAKAQGQASLAKLAALEAEQDARIAASEVEAMASRNRETALKEAVKQHHRLDREGMALADKIFADLQAKTYAASMARQAGFSKERAAQAQAILDGLRDLEAYERKQKEVASAPAPTSGRVASAPAGGGPPEDPMAYARVYAEGLKELTKEQAEAIRASEVAYGESSSTILEIKRSELEKMLALEADGHAKGEAAKRAMLDKQAASLDAIFEADRAAEDARIAEGLAKKQAEADKAVAIAEDQANRERDARAKLAADLYVLAVNNSAKMLAVDLQDKEKSKTAAQRATAAVISGLGDMAMVKSGLAAAAGNFAEAAAFSTAGTFAYALAAKLAPTEKSKTTPPAAAVNAPSAQNVSYNLRVDAAFADGESVARRFAEMQRGAQRRGLI
jgi:hypothetical protein